MPKCISVKPSDLVYYCYLQLLIMVISVDLWYPTKQDCVPEFIHTNGCVCVNLFLYIAVFFCVEPDPDVNYFWERR